jgi:histone acetyltransferase (RNA polymerase elongator complex component)
MNLIIAEIVHGYICGTILRMKKFVFLVVLFCSLQSCVKNKCVVCNDANGNSTGIKCFQTTAEALAWEAVQDSANPNKPINCSK